MCAEMGGNSSTLEGTHVVVVGGGFGGMAAARYLRSRGISFTLIDMRDSFHHNVAALRASVVHGKSHVSLPIVVVLQWCERQTHSGDKNLNNIAGQVILHTLI